MLDLVLPDMEPDLSGIGAAPWKAAASVRSVSRVTVNGAVVAVATIRLRNVMSSWRLSGPWLPLLGG